ncbi:V-set and transmembrane domain-containing protein 1 isoform X2 [Phyllostomus discolor]|uniref:V-set and transmembrane domain-containing protein 1 isoform X2 n=1 Tax=Phyllostomus discolor TaxID=89673 RepID=A0A7E6CNQ5_9CHIR|nr:V-set and transmembrane domain-containing protein 1 isoform X2 [Phyllostomus discolor]
MIAGFLSLLCLGLCLGFQGEHKNDTRDGSGASSVKTDTRVIFVTTFSCLIIFLLFPSIFLIYRCTQNGSSHKEATKRTSHSKFPKQEASDLPKLETESLSTEDPQEDTPADVNNEALAEEEPLGSCE